MEVSTWLENTARDIFANMADSSFSHPDHVAICILVMQKTKLMLKLLNLLGNKVSENPTHLTGAYALVMSKYI
jgi:hypothetical protein